MKFKVISLLALIFFGLHVSESNAVFYGEVIMHNPKVNKTVVFFYDIHKSHNATQKHQQEIINLAKKFQEKGQNVHVLVEDLLSRMEKLEQEKKYEITHKSADIIFLESSLKHLKKRCIEEHIKCTNIDFRAEVYGTYLTRKKLKIWNETDYDTKLELSSIHSNFRDVAEDYRCYQLEANIINKIRKSNANIIFVCVGGTHAASVSRILWQQGYQKTKVKEQDNIQDICKQNLYFFSKDNPLQRHKDDVYQLPESLTFKDIFKDIETMMTESYSIRIYNYLTTHKRAIVTAGLTLGALGLAWYKAKSSMPVFSF